eukprot:jgi/Mesen1/5184/ME000257S04454
MMIGNGVIGVLKEDRYKWERRAPLTPAHCAKLLRMGAPPGKPPLRIIVQPCTKRIHTDLQYQEVGCEISDDLSECGLIIGVKQAQVGTLQAERAYMFFSHTHKAQPDNMPLLDEVLEKRVTLYDYELIVGSTGKRQVAFGEFAGRAGMIDFLRGLGERCLSLGLSTPLLALGSAYMYTSLSAAKAAVLAVGDQISAVGLPAAVAPLVFVFTGTGNERGGRGRGPHNDSWQVGPPAAPVNCMYWERRYPRLLTNSQLRHLATAPAASEHGGGASCRLLGVADITYNPIAETHHDDMEGPGVVILAVDILPTELAKESTKHFGDALSPFLGHLAFARVPEDAPGPLTRACIAHGGQLAPLYEYIHRMREAQQTIVPLEGTGNDHTAPVDSFTTLVSLDGHLFDQFLINEALDVIETAGGNFQLATWRVGKNSHVTSYVELEVSHESSNFRVSADSAEQLARIVESLAAIATHSAPPPRGAAPPAPGSSRHGDSPPLIVGSPPGQVIALNRSSSSGISRKSPLGSPKKTPPLDQMGNEAGARKGAETDEGAKADNGSKGGDDAKVAARVTEMAAAAGAEQGRGLKRSPVAAVVPGVLAAQVDTSDTPALESLVAQADVVISMLPPFCHVAVAEACIQADVVISMLPPFCHVAVAEACIQVGDRRPQHKKHLVTASYVSVDMDALHARAQAAGVTLLCEMGLDPGIDHMSAMRMIDRVHSAGGRVESFVSSGGGLPAPAAANNPLAYKFRWHWQQPGPVQVCEDLLSSAEPVRMRHLPAFALERLPNRDALSYGHLYGIDHEAHTVFRATLRYQGEDLLSSAEPVRMRHLPAFALERLPNRDALSYGHLYGIDHEAHTVFRATLRYQGFSEIMAAIAAAGLFDTCPLPPLRRSSPPSAATRAENNPCANGHPHEDADTGAHAGADDPRAGDAHQDAHSPAEAGGACSCACAGAGAGGGAGAGACAGSAPPPSSSSSSRKQAASSSSSASPPSSSSSSSGAEASEERGKSTPAQEEQQQQQQPLPTFCEVLNMVVDSNGHSDTRSDVDAITGCHLLPASKPEEQAASTARKNGGSLSRHRLPDGDHPRGQQADVLLRLKEKLIQCHMDADVAARAVDCLRWLGMAEDKEVPPGVSCALDALCACMEARMQYAPDEQDMVLLHHELEVSYPDGRSRERHLSTLLAFGSSGGGIAGAADERRAPAATAMATTVGLPAAIGAQLLLSKRVKATGVVRPLAAEIYDPALQVLEALGVCCEEHIEIS